MDVQYHHITPYNTAKLPNRQPRLLTALLCLASRMTMPKVPYKIEKFGMEGMKPPFILLSNHMYFVDFKLSAMATYPFRVNNIATIDGYYKRAWLMELLGCICKRKFTSDLHLIRSIRHVLRKNGDVLCMYPEARYSPVGTTAILPDALGKLIKMSGVPVAVLLHHGNYLHTPFWNYRKPRKLPLYSTLTKVLSEEDVKTKSVEEINCIVREAMTYDEYKWQQSQGIRITEPFRAEGLHKVLYHCPACGKEHEMDSFGAELFCHACGKRWKMDELGQLSAIGGKTEFSHIPDWYEWERSEVRRQIEEGCYHFSDEVDVYSLPWCKEFEHLGKATLTHDAQEGFILEGVYGGAPYRIQRKPLSMYGVHIEYDYCYLRPEDCIDISTDNDSFYCYPTQQNVVTKLSLATEELYRFHKARVDAEKRLRRTEKMPVVIGDKE